MAEIHVMVDDEVNSSVQSLDPAIQAGREPYLTTETKSHDMPPIDPQGIATIGHRRGRRKVVKKIMLKDEEGYLGGVHQRKMKPYYHKLIYVFSYEGRTIMGVFFRGRNSCSKRYHYSLLHGFIRSVEKNGWERSRARKY